MVQGDILALCKSRGQGSMLGGRQAHEQQPGHVKHGLTCELVQEGDKVQDLGGRKAQDDRG